MGLPGQIYAVRRIIFDVGEIREAVEEYLGRPGTDEDVIAYISENAYDEFGTQNFCLYDPEQDRDIS